MRPAPCPTYLLGSSTVDDVFDVGDGEGGFCHVGRYYDQPMAFGRLLEDLHLLVSRQEGVQG